MTSEIDKNRTMEANIAVHSALANSGEYNRSPHFRPENQEKVRARLETIAERYQLLPYCRLLDIGCGTGFIIHLVHDLVDEVHGLDITEDMMKQVDLGPGNISLFTAPAESTPFEAERYHIVTAYSFLDHVADYRAVLKEAYRLLKPGGTFYSDLNPNRFFGALMRQAESLAQADLPEIVDREIQGMLHNGEYYEEQFGIDGETLIAAEPIKTFDLGFDPYEFLEVARSIGFRDASYSADWFLGQAAVLHGKEPAQAAVIDEYLQGGLPATLSLYKYLKFDLVK